ncbi:MAG: hypothetical protein SFX73_23460 [Kofleriaceae bacterium]|nr:hypothetical protein [Kofleriaceae bacterium]
MKALALLAVAVGCSGQPADLGLDEPVRVRGGQFIAGPLPGADTDAPAITLVETQGSVVRVGQGSKVISGRTSTDAVAVGIAFAELGTGYWVSPLGPRDPTAGNELTWSLDLSLAWDLPIGPAALDVVAIDDAEHAGRPQRIDVCVRPDLLDNSATCNPELAPPDTVLSLAWDTSVDLDLWVITPDGKQVDASHPSTISHDPPITQAELSGPGVGQLDRDSNAGCRIDGINREALVFQTPPAPGTYVVYANLHDACGNASVNFSARLYRAEPQDVGARLVEVERQDGRLLGAAANGGRGPGLYLMQLAL